METNINIRVGEAVRRYRVVADITQDELADRLDVAQATIHNIETGKRSINIEEIVELANALGIDIDDLLDPDVTLADITADMAVASGNTNVFDIPIASNMETPSATSISAEATMSDDTEESTNTTGSGGKTKSNKTKSVGKTTPSQTMHEKTMPSSTTIASRALANALETEALKASYSSKSQPSKSSNHSYKELKELVDKINDRFSEKQNEDPYKELRTVIREEVEKYFREYENSSPLIPYDDDQIIPLTPYDDQIIPLVPDAGHRKIVPNRRKRDVYPYRDYRNKIGRIWIIPEGEKLDEENKESKKK